MAFKYREEIVGKRFLSISSDQNVKLSKLSEWGWRAGIIRAASHSDSKNQELSVLVEYDDLDWKKREWIKVYEDDLFKVFLIEKSLVWCTRNDPHSSGRRIEWPAIVFSILVDLVNLGDKKYKFIEFLGDNKIEHVTKTSQITVFQNVDRDKKPACQNYPEVRKAIKEWTEYQDGQRILLTTPSVLVGYRIEVYRAEGTTQWYTAVIISYNDNTKELTVTDDTVLEDHNEDPCLVQMKLIGDGVVESILRGENVGIKPRRRSCTVQHTQIKHHHNARTRSGYSHHNTSTSQRVSNAKTSSNCDTTVQRKSRPTALPSSNRCQSPKNSSILRDIIKLHSKPRKRNNCVSGKQNLNSVKLSPKVVIEKCEAKVVSVSGSDKQVVKRSCLEKVKKVKKKDKILTDLPAHVTEHILSAIESVIQKYQPSISYQDKKSVVVVESNIHVKERKVDKISSIVNKNLDSINSSDKCCVDDNSGYVVECNTFEASNNCSKSPSTLSLDEQFSSFKESATISYEKIKCNGDTSDNNRADATSQQIRTNDMDCRFNESNIIEPRVKNIQEDRQSDSGISEKLSSARSSSEGSSRSSGDERSVSRSSESSRLSDTSDTAISIPPTLQSTKHPLDNCNNGPDRPRCKNSVSPLVFDKSEPLKVYRDPELLNASSQSIRHISSVQHSSMQHPNSNNSHSQPPAASNGMGYHTLTGHHSAPPPGAASSRLASPHQHSRPGTAPLPITVPASSSSSLSSQQQLPSFHSGLGSLPTPPQPHVQQPQFANYGHPILPHSHQTAALMMSQYGNMHPSAVDILAQQKFSPGAPWTLQQVRDQEFLLGRERAMAAEWERSEREKKEKLNREKLEKEKKEAEIEKYQQEERERVNREVQQHFEESLLRLANQKKPVAGIPPTWNSHGASQTSKSTSGYPHSVGVKEVVSLKSEPIISDVSSKYSVSAMDARYKQELIRKQEEEKLYHSQKHNDIRHRPMEKPRLESNVYRPVTSSTSNMSSISKGQPNYPAYCYQKYQHSYMNQDSVAHRALTVDNIKLTQGSITSGKPVERRSTTPDSKLTIDRTASPKCKGVPKPVGAFKPYEQLPVAATKPSSGLLRIAEPHYMNKNHDVMSHHHAAIEKSSMTKSSHHSLVQQGLVPNPLYARVTPGSPRPAHSTIDHKQSAASLAIPTPSPAHMSNSSHHRHNASSSSPHPQRTIVNENHYKPLLPSGQAPSNVAIHPSLSSLPQGQPLDLQSAASKRKSQEVAEDFSMKKIKQEPGVSNMNVASTLTSATVAPTNLSTSQVAPKNCPLEQPQNTSYHSVNVKKENPVGVETIRLPNVNMQPKNSSGNVLPGNDSNAPPPPPPIKKEESVSPTTTTFSATTVSSSVVSSVNASPVIKNLKKAWLQRHSGEDSNSAFPVKAESASVLATDSSSTNVISSILSNKPFKPLVKEVKNNVTVNGHVSEISSSSSSETDQDSNANKRKGALKSKQKQNAKKPKIQNEDIVSDNERNSKSPVSSTPDQPKKRGRRPKGKNIDEKKKPAVKMEKSLAVVPKNNADSYLQNGSCCEVASKLPKCRECRMTPHQRNKNLPNIFCRFYAFRKLKPGKNSTVSIAGFSEPSQASEEDLKLWLPRIDAPPTDLDVETSKFLVAHVGDQFCDLVEQEQEAISIHMCEDKTVTWKKVVQGVREMCDVCETTLFNIHWVCHKCGFVVCIDCYKARKKQSIKEEENPSKDRDGYQWLFCNNKHPHDQSKLMLTQIIAGNALWEIGKLIHDVRKKFKIPAHCRCCQKESDVDSNGDDDDDDADKTPVNGINKKLLNCVAKSPDKSLTLNGKKLNGISNKDISNYNSDTSSPLSWLADVALNSSAQLQENKEKGKKDAVFDYPSHDSYDKTDSEGKSDDNDENFSTLRELLIRPHPGPKSSISNKNATRKAVSSATTLDDVINCVIEQNIKKGDDGSDLLNKEEMQLVHFTRRYPQFRNGREPLPVRVCSLAESTEKYPNLPHSWLCGGRLLRLHDPLHEDNLSLFQEQWKRGQPVVVSDVTKKLDKKLWHPNGFSKDFGDVKVDLVNCRKGTVIPNQQLHKFWDGFDNFSKRLKDEDTGEPSLLKLKDWPPGEDFSEILPTRFNDLMKALPLPMYTHRDGVHNLAGRLPECFVKPDLGPKMYNAYGLAKYPNTGTTNLHLDISDAVNVMVYVGIPEDGDDEDHIEKAFEVIDDAGCDALTRQRIRGDKEKPGALWHIYNARDADKIRDLLNKVAIESGESLESHHDPIHDQSWYLDKELRNRLYKEYGVEGYTIVQCLGDSVFIPAGAPHQVQNLHSCIKVAEDFVSPENVSHCFTLTEEFRYLSDTHTNHEDKLQIKNIIFHAIKDGLAVLLGSMSSS